MTVFLASQRLAISFTSHNRHFSRTYGVLKKCDSLLFKSPSLLRFQRQIKSVVPHIIAVTPTEKGTAVNDAEIRRDLASIYKDTRETLGKSHSTLTPMAQYYFDDEDKAIRPVITICFAKAINSHLTQTSADIFEKQKKVAQVDEMIFTLCLVHDDVIDSAESRRNKISTNRVWGQKKSIAAGDFIFGRALAICASLQNELVYELVTKMVADLVNGELLQLDGCATEDERFVHYLEKTFKKTASLTAHSCQSVSVLAGADTALQNIAFQFGRQLGIAFQLVDDVLDLATDLREGLATAPVLFAAYQFPELNPLIRRRFNQPKDVETAYRLVHRSDGLQRAKQLASQYCDDAVAQLARLSPSSYQQILYSLIRKLLNEME